MSDRVDRLDLRTVGGELSARAASASSDRATHVVHAAPDGSLTQLRSSAVANRRITRTPARRCCTSSVVK